MMRPYEILRSLSSQVRCPSARTVYASELTGVTRDEGTAQEAEATASQDTHD